MEEGKEGTFCLYSPFLLTVRKISNSGIPAVAVASCLENKDSQPKLDSRRMLAYLVHEARILEKQNGQYRARRCSRALKMKVKLSSMQTHIACGYACA